MQFSDVFWNGTFGDYSGFDVVCDYVRTGRHACSSVAEFLKARAQIEETYAKQLLTLAKSQTQVKFDGSVGKSWDAVLTSAQKASASHQKLADVFNQQSQLTNQLTKTLKQKAKQKEEEVRTCQNECRSLFEKALKNKTEFVKRADQKRSLEEEKERLKRDASSGSSSQSPPNAAKDLQKLDMSIRKAVSSADTSRQQCVNVLEQLDVANEQWEIKTTSALMGFNEMEKNRVIYLRSLFWALMNAICQCCVDLDKECDNVRNVILKCDPDTDLEEFITSRKTGEKRPASITFENIGNTTLSPNAQSQRTFKMSFGKKLGNPWKSSNGQNAAANSAPQPTAGNGKAPSAQKSSFQQHQPLTERQFQSSPEEAMPGPDSRSASTSPPPLSPGSPTPLEKGENGFHVSPPSVLQLKQQKVALKPQTSKAKTCLVTRTWADNQGTVLVEGNTKAKLLEKSSNALWLIELDDHQTLYCPIEYLEEL